MSHSIAVKCIYNDADEGALVGFKGVCSLDLMQQYVKCKEIHCGREQCACHTWYFRDRMQGERPAFPCMESRLFRDWVVAVDQGRASGDGNSQDLIGAGSGDFAVLTTTRLGALESERTIIGLFRIGQITNRGGEVRVVAAPTGRIRLPLEEARQLYFWAYCDTESHRPEWHHGLFRPLDLGQVHRILADVAQTARDAKTRTDIDHLIQTAFGPGPAPQAAGCLREKSAGRKTEVAQARKYGLGGEGLDHRRLKEWLRQHPEAIGITDAIHVTAEYVLPSGDCADLVFQRRDGGFCVVAIETTASLAAAYQLIKHRALLCAEQGLALNDPDVDAFLVAGSLPGPVKEFCQRYDVVTRQFSLRS
jgi:hypothetical protein